MKLIYAMILTVALVFAGVAIIDARYAEIDRIHAPQ